MVTTLHELADRWEQDADKLDALGYVAISKPIRTCVDQLRAALRAEPDAGEVERAAEAVAVVVASIDCDKGPDKDPTGMEACRRVAIAALTAARSRP